MKKIFFPILCCIIFLSGCVESPEDAGDRISQEEYEYRTAYDDGYAAGYAKSKTEETEKLENEISALKKQIEDLEWEIGFYMDQVVLVTKSDRLIHDYSCPSSSASYYEAILLDDPVLKIYELCPDCCDSYDEEIIQVLP